MYVSDAIGRIVEELEFMEAERRELNANGPHFRIVHRCGERFAPPGRRGKVVAVYLVHRGRTVQVRLGAILLGLFEYMARRNKLAQTAKQIESGTRASCSSGTWRASALTRCIPRRYVRVYVKRIRAALGEALREAGLGEVPDAVLASDDMATNETGYRLRGTVEWTPIV